MRKLDFQVNLDKIIPDEAETIVEDVIGITYVKNNPSDKVKQLFYPHKETTQNAGKNYAFIDVSHYLYP